MGRVRSRKRRVRDDDFLVGSGRMWSDYRRIVFLLAEAFRELPLKSWASRFRGKAHYLVRLQGAFACSAQWKWGCICDADHWWRSFCVAGAVFGEVGGWLYLLQALEMTFHMWRRSLMTCILRGRRSIWWGWRVTLLAPPIGNDVSYVRQISDDLDIAWQGQVFGEGWRVTSLSPRIGNEVSYVTQIIDDVHFCVAGAVFGDVGGWLYLLHALEMTFHMWRRSLMTFIVRGRRSIWWSWTVILVAPRIVNDVSK